MERTANEIQKEIEDKADELIKKRDVATLTSINEKRIPAYLLYCLLQRQKNFQMFTL